MYPSAPARLAAPSGRWYVPSLVDIFFAVLLVAGFARPGGWQQMLADGDTGWHIRTGEQVLATGRAPVADGFSFTRPGQRWYAWEWLADAVFAAAFRAGGLGAVSKLAGCVLCLAGALLFGWLLRRGAGLWIALVVTLGAVSASSVHYLARPHVFSILFYVVALRILDGAREGRRALVWLLPPLCGLWANLHGGFVALPATLAAAALADALARRGRDARLWLAASLACLAGSLANPYGWRLHQHILAYLNSSWILDHVQEFQSPNIRSEGMVVFAVLLLAAVALASRAMARGCWFEGALAVAWGFAALRSARHIPFFAIAAAPVVAGECAAWWRQSAVRRPVRSTVGILWELAQDLGRRRAVTIWLPVLGMAATASSPGAGIGFAESRFPVRAVERNAGVLGAGTMPRILTSDQWGDYLIYRMYPRQRVFFDGRSDFYGPELGADYNILQSGAPGWRELVARYRFDLALLPRPWPLSTALEREPGWQRVYMDDISVLYRRTTANAQEVP